MGISIYMRTLSILALCALILSGCATHVKFYDRVAQETSSETSLSLYLDQFGDVYGPDDRSLVNGAGEPDALRCAFDKALCKPVNEKTDIVLAKWRIKQNDRWDAQAQSVIDALEASDGFGPIVMLIHGFRAEDASCDYRIAQERIAAIDPSAQQPYFVHVHWDGRTSGLIGAPKAWFEAQWSGPIVGFRLRRFVNLLNQKHVAAFKEPPALRILTHSSGAFVGAAIFGDSGASLPCLMAKEFRTDKYNIRRNDCGATYLAFDQHRGDETLNNLDAVPKIKDLRMGMLAPATAGTSFIGSTRSDWAGKGLMMDPQNRLVIGYNPKDEAITKHGLPTKTGGESGLAASSEQICSIVGKFDGSDQPLIFPMNLYRTGAFRVESKTHDFSVYLKQDEFMAFALALFGSESPDRMSEDLCLTKLKAWDATYRNAGSTIN